MTVKVATIMSVYHSDDPQALATALKSVIDQQFTGMVESRLYVAIDGPVSKDLSCVLSEYSPHIYSIIRLERNCGLATALNTLIRELSDEQFVFRMDADDRSYPNRYQTQLDFFQKNPGIDIVGTDIIEAATESGIHRRVSFCRGPIDALNNLSWRVPVAHPTVCFRRKVLDKIGGYPLAGTNEDIALWLRCAQAGFKFDNVDQPLYEFTVTQNFWRRRSFSKAFSELRCYVSGIWAMHGISWKYVLPLTRFILRLSPQGISRLVYSSSIRRASRG